MLLVMILLSLIALIICIYDFPNYIRNDNNINIAIWNIVTILGLLVFTILGLTLQTISLEEGGSATKRLISQVIRKHIRLELILAFTTISILYEGLFIIFNHNNTIYFSIIILFILIIFTTIIGKWTIEINDPRVLFQGIRAKITDDIETVLKAPDESMDSKKIRPFSEQIPYHYIVMIELIERDRWQLLNDHIELRLEVLRNCLEG
jgi:hypothetical protein